MMIMMMITMMMKIMILMIIGSCFDLQTPVKGTPARQYYAMSAYYWVFGIYLDFVSANMTDARHMRVVALPYCIMIG